MNKPDPHIAALKIWFAGLLLGPFIFILFASLFDIFSSGAAGMGSMDNLPVATVRLLGDHTWEVL